ncbi:hypothetical protein KUTeg_018567 [Tegillarca granosa]|uniref:Beta-lactamase-related domain-containing protein n=1 Tax=Tegillarca granosa TaxID=220873 RepID=A0ABQ9EI45_TEGGR|nr:hypothetical protein KUTeg_018567 [Tegillarca granosa]
MGFYIFLCFIVILECYALHNPSPSSTDLDKILQHTLRCRNIPGLSVSVVKRGQIVYAKGYGVKNMKTNEKVSSKTLFGIASLTKAFTSTLIVKLLEDKQDIHLNTPIRIILNTSDHLFEDELRSRYATLKDLLAHRLGIPSHNYIRFDDTLTRENLVSRLRHLKGHGIFRDSFYYSNIMYGLLTYISEKLGGRTWEELVKEKLFDPLDMTASSFSTRYSRITKDVAQGYIDFYGTLHQVPVELSRRWGLLCGSGCIFSNAIDMAKWMMFHLRGGRNHSGYPVVDDRLLTQTHIPSNHLPTRHSVRSFNKPYIPYTTSYNSYAMGWKNGFYRGYKTLSHTGTTWGYNSALTLLPEMDLGIFTVFTGADYDYNYRTSLHNYIADIYTGEQPWLNITTLCTFPQPWIHGSSKKSIPSIRKDRKASRHLSMYVGIYKHPAYGSLIIKNRPGTNQLVITYGWSSLILYPKHSVDEFYGETIGIAAKIINFGIFKFNFNSTTKIIDSVKVPAFERNDPPIFVKHHLEDVGSK